jgi:DNA-binding response OmpR family regulator
LISDTGIGIKEEDRDKIFDRFYRVEGQWEKDGSGTGIGLSITNEFVNLLHGQIEVVSDPSTGSAFKVSIPIGKEHLSPDEFVIVDTQMHEESDQITEAYDHAAIYEKENEEPGPSRHHLLIIEDNNDLRSFIRDNLISEYSVYEADNGKTGLNIALSKIPDLIITDIIMPDLDGVTLCNRIKNDERTSHIPVIMLTAKTSQEDKIEGLKSGADEYLFKPFSIDELKARISNLLDQRERLKHKFGLLSGYEQPGREYSNREEEFIQKVTNIIYSNMHNFEFDAGGLQEEIGMSRANLYRKLMALTGMSPGIIIRNCRMKQAAKLIRNKAGNLTEIAFSTGFSNPSYFSKCFREYYGVSPKEFSKSQKEISGPDRQR